MKESFEEKELKILKCVKVIVRTDSKLVSTVGVSISDDA